CLPYTALVILDKGRPSGIIFGARSTLFLESMADRYGQSVSSIEKFRSLFELQEVLQHSSDLFFAGVSASGDGLLDLSRRILEYGNVPVQGCCHGHSLSSSQFQHHLY